MYFSFSLSLRFTKIHTSDRVSQRNTVIKKQPHALSQQQVPATGLAKRWASWLNQLREVALLSDKAPVSSDLLSGSHENWDSRGSSGCCAKTS